MTSMQGSDSGWLLNFTKEVKDLNRPNLGYISNKYTIMGLIENNSDFTIFNFIVRKARYEMILDNLSENITLFVPSDKQLLEKYPLWFFESMDYLSAKEMVMSHIIERKITLEMLMNSNAQRFVTKHRTGRFKTLYTSYTKDYHMVTINESKIIEGNMMLQNGIIHVTDDFVFRPDCSNN